MFQKKAKIITIDNIIDKCDQIPPKRESKNSIKVDMLNCDERSEISVNDVCVETKQEVKNKKIKTFDPSDVWCL